LDGFGSFEGTDWFAFSILMIIICLLVHWYFVGLIIVRIVGVGFSRWSDTILRLLGFSCGLKGDESTGNLFLYFD
jgi:hypothetical protein